MKCVFSNCRKETDKYVTLGYENENGDRVREIIAVCDPCTSVFLAALREKYRSLRIICANILGYGLAALILPALIFDIVRIPALIVCPLIAAVFIPLTVIFRRREIICGNDLIDGELEKYRTGAALKALEESERKYFVLEKDR